MRQKARKSAAAAAAFAPGFLSLFFTHNLPFTMRGQNHDSVLIHVQV